MSTMFIANSDFPLESIELLRTRLDAYDIVVAGYIAPEVGTLDWRGIRFDQNINGLEFYFILDRNLTSRMAKVAMEGIRNTSDATQKIAVDLMAFGQAMDMIFDPTISFHELAHMQGNDAALKEFAWFRVADEAAPMAWIDFALERKETIKLGHPSKSQFMDLAAPLKRWERNYLVMLKIAEIELVKTRLTGIEKMQTLLDWMQRDFYVAGPATIYATLFFSPNGPGKKLFKKLRSVDRESAVRGIKNAAWDATYLSEFIRHVNTPEESKKLYLFASADKALTDISRMIFATTGQTISEDHLAKWWGLDSHSVAAALKLVFEIAGKINPVQRPYFSKEEMKIRTVRAEELIRNRSFS